MKKSSYVLALLLIVVLVGCNLPATVQPTSSSPDAAFTQAAQTVAAELTRVAVLASPTSNIPTNTLPPTNTSTPAATNTPNSTVTNTPIPCLLVGYNNATIDVTVPDNTVMSPGQVFTKTWRLNNAGTCTWNSSYQLVFDHGDGMGVPAGYSQTLTAGSVTPGQTVDVSVSLTASTSPGTYTGYWHFRDPNGVFFGIGGSGAWVVKIKVVNSATVTLMPVVGESGTLRADAGPFPDYTVGESNVDITKTVEAFLSFDISGIPANATITEVKTNFTNYTTEGTPFGLGVLNGYVSNYGPTLEVADFVVGFPTGNTVDWGSTTALSTIEASPELKAALQSKIGTNRLQLRLQFPGSNSDIVKDRITFANPSLVIKYVTP
jgi:hypothetical protein